MTAAALLSSALVACAPPDDGTTLEVRAPLAGAVHLDDQTLAVAPLAPARFTLRAPGPHTLTYTADAGALTLVDVDGPLIDLAPLLDARPPIRGVLYPLELRATPGARVVAVADGQLFTPTASGDRLRLHLPDAPTTLVALWTDPPRLTRIPVPSPRLEAGAVIELTPRVALTAELLVALDAAPRGRVVAELTEQGLRTGLRLADGLADTATALVVPRPPDPSPHSGLWITATDQSTGEAARRETTAALPLDAPGVVLTWPPTPTADPPPRDAARALPLDPTAGWTLTGAPDAGWIEIELEGRGACADSRRRVIVPPDAPLIVPPAPGLDPFAAPLVFARIRAIHPTGATLADLLAHGPAPIELPQWLARRATATTEGYFESGAETCDPPPLRGLYALAAPADACDPATPAPRAAITRCGHLVALAGDDTLPLACGRFTGNDPLRYETRGQGTLPVGRDGATLTVPTATGAVRLTPIDPATATEPPTATGDYTRFTLARQPIDPQGRATGDPVVIDGGPAPDGPAATFARGDLRVRTRWWSFDARLLTADGETARALADTGGCAERPAELRITWSPNAVRIDGDAADRRYQLTLRR